LPVLPDFVLIRSWFYSFLFLASLLATASRNLGDTVQRDDKPSAGTAKRRGRRPVERLLRTALTRFIRSGNLRITTVRGNSFLFGDGSGPPIAVRFTSPGAIYRILLDPELRLGEAYKDGTLVIEQGSLADLLTLLLGQDSSGKPPFFARPQWLMRYLKRRLSQLNRRQR
jgi:hypothetical protein